MKKTFIVDAVRTPITRGDGTGALYEVFPNQLLGGCMAALSGRNDSIIGETKDVLVGSTIPYHGSGQNFVKSTLDQYLPDYNIPGLHINRGMLSGLDGLRMATNEAADSMGFWLAGGVESHSYLKSPYQRNAGIADAAVSMHWQADLLGTIQSIQEEDIRQYRQQMFQHYLREIDSEQPLRTLVKDPSGLIIANADEVYSHQEWNGDNKTIKPSGALESALINYFPSIEQITALHTVHDKLTPGDGSAMAIIANEVSVSAFDITPLAEIKSIQLATGRHYAIWEGAIHAMEEALKESGMHAQQIDQWLCLDQYHAFGIYFQQQFEVPMDKWNRSFQSTFFPIPDGAVGMIALIQLIQLLQRMDQQFGALLIPDQWGMGIAVIMECI